MAGRHYSTKFGGSLTAEDTEPRPDYTERIKRVAGAPAQPQQESAPVQGDGE